MLLFFLHPQQYFCWSNDWWMLVFFGASNFWMGPFMEAETWLFINVPYCILLLHCYYCYYYWTIIYIYINITCLLLLLIPPFLEWWPCWPSYFWLWLNLRATDGWGVFFHINFTEFSASSRLRSLWDSIGFPSPSDWRPIGGHLQFAFEPSLPWQHSKVPKCVDCQLPKSLSPSFPMVIANENEDIAVSAGPKARR